MSSQESRIAASAASGTLRRLLFCLPVFALITLGPLTLGSCVSDQETYTGGSGELGKGSFFIPCSTDDAACDDSPSRLASDVPLAVGASSPISYEGFVPEAPNGDPTTMTVFSASPSMLSFDESELFAWLPGTVAVLARSAEGTVTDFAHLTLVPIARIDVEPNAGQTTLSVGQQGVWKATPRDTSGQVLGGCINYGWQVEGSAVQIAEQTGRTVTLIAQEAGTSTLRATASDVVGEATILVEAP